MSRWLSRRRISTSSSGEFSGRVAERPWGVIVRTRWVLVIGTAYTILFGSGGPPRLWPHHVLVAALLLSNLSLWLLLRRGVEWKQLGWVFPAIDVATVTLAVNIVGEASTNLFLVYFAVLVLATVIPNLAPVAAITLIGALMYGLTLYVEVGDKLWRSPELLVRMPFLVAVALYFGTVVQEARRDHDRTKRLSTEARQIAQRAKHLAKEQYRLQALTEIGRLGLTGVRAEPGNILFDIIQRVQRVVGVDRCSLIIFERDGASAYVAASGDDPNVEVLVLKMEEYPELQVSLQRGEITELYPGHPPDLWHRVQRCLPASNPFRSFLVVPIQRGGRLLGAFYLRDARSDHRFSEDDRTFCWTASMMTAAFIHGHDLLEQLRKQSRRDGLTGLLNFQAFTQEAARAIQEDAGIGEAMSLVVADLDNLKEVNDRWGHIAGNRLIITVGNHLTAVMPDAQALCRYGGDEFVALVPGTKEETAEVVEDFLEKLTNEPTDLPRPPRISVGIAEYPGDGEDHEELLELADQAMYLAKDAGGHRIWLAGAGGLDSQEWKQAVLEAVVSVQARRHLPDEERSVREILAPLESADGEALTSPAVRDTLATLMRLVEAKDPYAHAHSMAVAELSRRLAEALNFPDDELVVVEVAGLVHDLGKIGVPSEILGKQGRLSNVERHIMERHPAIAAQLLQRIPPLKRVVPLVFHHGERWDGSGYPEGLKGEQIPRGARVVGVCDAYNALTSARSFRSALNSVEACQVISRDAGTLWEPAVVQVFVEQVVTDDQTEPAAAAKAPS